ncbi:MAG: DUF1361 domain-containing protein [Bacteroidetes bacterium]|nr:DUF1361 domain-containing protein [Bacteroidota bacterium]
MMKNNIQFHKLGSYLLITIGFSLGMLLLRIIITGSIHYAFLVWNLFLAIIPLWISSRIIKRTYRKKWIEYLIPGVLWLLFLPNAPYIITDFIHLDNTESVPHWFDLMLILSFAWNGLLFWLVTMFHFYQFMSDHIRPNIKSFLIQFITLLSSVGVYLGRFGRFNSWDAFFEPIGIIERVIYMILHPTHYPGFYGMTLTVYVFLALLFRFFQHVGHTGRPGLPINLQA